MGNRELYRNIEGSFNEEQAKVIDFLITNQTRNFANSETFHDFKQEINEVKSDISKVKQDLNSVELRLTKEINDVKSELKQEINDVELRLTKEIAGVKSEFKQEIAGVKSDISVIKADIAGLSIFNKIIAGALITILVGVVAQYFVK